MRDDGGPAFPSIYGATEPLDEGMSLRDYFAAKAIQGMLADPGVRDMDQFMEHGPRQAYAVADAMIAERESAHSAP